MYLIMKNPNGVFQKVLAPKLSILFIQIFLLCLGLHIIYLPHINMSVLTKEKKKHV